MAHGKPGMEGRVSAVVVARCYNRYAAIVGILPPLMSGGRAKSQSYRYELFLKFLADGQLDDVLTGIHSLQLDQGFEDPSELCKLDVCPRSYSHTHQAQLAPRSCRPHHPPP